MRGRPQRPFELLHRREIEPRFSRADDHRRNEDVQPIDAAGVDESGNRLCPTLDEQATEAAFETEHRDDGRRRTIRLTVLATRGSRIDLRFGNAAAGGRHHEPRSAVSGEPAATRLEAAVRIDDDAGRIASLCTAAR